MSNILKYIIVYFLFFFVFFTNSNAYELSDLNDGKTIKEIKANIDYLDKTNSGLGDEIKNLNIDYELKTYLKIDLSETEIINLKNLINLYNLKKIEIEGRIFDKTKSFESAIDDQKSLLELKKKFYSDLTQFINTDFSDEYIDFIKNDARIFSEKNELSNDILIQKEILNNKVEKIETKIQEHKNYINENIKKIIENRLDEKIKNLSNNETFKSLSKESKKKVLDKTIEKIKIKINKLKENNFGSGSLVVDTGINNKKIQTYLIAVNKLEQYRDSIK